MPLADILSGFTLSGGPIGGEEEQSLLGGRAPSVDTFQNLTPEQKKALEALLTQMSQTGPAYTGTLTADPNALQGTSLAALEQAALNATSPEGTTSTATGALADALKQPSDMTSDTALKDILGQGTNAAASTALTDILKQMPGGDSSIALRSILNQAPQDLTDYFQSAVYDPAMEQFQNEILPAITQRFSGLSGFGSDRMNMEAKAAGQAATGIGAKVAETVQSQKQNAELNKIAAALGLSDIESKGNINKIAAALGISGIESQGAQNKIAAALGLSGNKSQALQDTIAAALGLSGIDTQGIQNLIAMQGAGNVAQNQAQLALTNKYAEFTRQQDAEAKRRQQLIDAIIAAQSSTTPIVQPGQSILGGFLGGGSGGALGSLLA